MDNLLNLQEDPDYLVMACSFSAEIHYHTTLTIKLKYVCRLTPSPTFLITCGPGTALADISSYLWDTTFFSYSNSKPVGGENLTFHNYY